MSVLQHEMNSGAHGLVSAVDDDVPAVVFVTSQFLPRIGGAEMSTLREAVALHALGHRIRIITLRLNRAWTEHEEREGVPVLRTGGLFLGTKLRLRFGAQWVAEIRLAWELLRSRASYDIIHMRQISFLARPVVLASIVARKPVVVKIASAGPGTGASVPAGTKTTMYVGTLDPLASYLQIPAGSEGTSDIASLRRSQWLAGLTLRLLRRRNVTILSVSQRATAHLIENGLRADQIVLQPTGVETGSYEEVYRQVEARSRVAHVPIVLYVGRYRYEKGVDVLLHAWSLVRAQGINARLVLVGGGQLQEQFAAIIDALGLQDSVELGSLRNDVRSVLGAADVFVLPSRYEGMPNALLEAMAAGLPCVATRVSGSEDIIEDGISGMLVPPGEPEPLARALVRLLTQPEEARVLGRAGHERIARYYERGDLMRQLEHVYERLTGTADARQPCDVHEAVSEPAATVTTLQE